MKILSICLAVLLLLLTLASLYEVYEIPKDWNSPLIPTYFVDNMQQAYIVWAVINFIFFLAFLYVAIKRIQLARFKILGTIFLLYIATILITSFINVNG